MSQLPGKPSGIGWVQLPHTAEQQLYHSGIDPFVQGFVGTEVCGECHQKHYRDYLKTAHFRTAEEATEETVLGSFQDGKNELRTRDPNLWFKMFSDERGLHVRLSVQREGQLYTHEVPIHISTGSGNHGQSFLYWQGSELYQLPVSYGTEFDGWITSPGSYVDGTADFGRGIGDRCLDCHATYFALAPGSFHVYDRGNYVLGITCVRCHGPGWAHVQYHRHHPGELKGRYVVNPRQLPRDRANEVCIQCHAGSGQLRQPAFTYWPGEPLAEYIDLDSNPPDPENHNPHGANQLIRLKKSRCFAGNDTFVCFDCHDLHKHERGDMPQFARRCAKCHPPTDCGLAEELGSRLVDRCVPCHMPSRRDTQVVMETAKGEFLPLIRDHYIQARSDATKEIVERIRAELLEAKGQ